MYKRQLLDGAEKRYGTRAAVLPEEGRTGILVLAIVLLLLMRIALPLLRHISVNNRRITDSKMQK